MKTVSTIILFLFAVCLQAQNFKSDFKKSLAFYNSSEDLSMTVSVLSYESSSDKKGSSLGTGKMYRTGDKYYSSFMNMEIIDDGSKVLMIDHSQKKASFYPDNSIISNVPAMDKDMDSLLKSSDSVIYNGKKEGGLHYTCFSKNDNIIEKYNMVLSEKDYHVVKIEFFYNQKSKDFEIDQYKMVVNYTSVSTAKVTDLEIFKVGNYLSAKGNGYQLAAKYSGYKLQVADKKKTMNKYIKG